MKITKSKSIIAALLCSVLLLGACTDKETKDVKDNKNEVVSESSAYADYMAKFIDTLEKGDIKTATKLMNDIFEKKSFTDSENSTIVDAYIYGLSLKSEEMNATITDYHPQIKKFIEEDKDFLKQEDINTIEDEKFKLFAQNVLDNYLVLYAINEEYYLAPDINYILDEYNEKMLPIFKDYLTVYNYISLPIEYNDSLSALLKNFEININLLQGYIDVYNKENYEDYDEKMNDYYINRAGQDILSYYDLFFGLNGQTLIDENETFKEEVLKYYESVLEDTSNVILKEKTRAIHEVIVSDKHKGKMSNELYNDISDLLKVVDNEGAFILEKNINTNKEDIKKLKEDIANVNIDGNIQVTTDLNGNPVTVDEDGNIEEVSDTENK